MKTTDVHYGWRIAGWIVLLGITLGAGTARTPNTAEAGNPQERVATTTQVDPPARAKAEERFLAEEAAGRLVVRMPQAGQLAEPEQPQW